MVKDPASGYSPGRRGFGWLKLKRPLATLDCVVVGVEVGHGKRHGVLSDYTFAVRDDRPDAPHPLRHDRQGLQRPDRRRAGRHDALVHATTPSRSTAAIAWWSPRSSWKSRST